MKKTMAIVALCCAASALARDTVVLVEAHPDDLAGHSGTALLLAEKFDVKVVDFTRGENGLGEAAYLDGSCARIRVEEEKKACAFLGVEPVFMGQVNYKGLKAFANEAATEELKAMFLKWKPRAVILHWPLDDHPDHVQSTAAALHALYLAKLNPEVYFQEQTTQSRNFRPKYHVDISRVKEKKDALIRCYVCQEGEKIRERKEHDSVFRGRRVGLGLAESFDALDGSVRNGKSVLFELDAKVW